VSGARPGLIDALTLERIEADLFRSSVVYADAFGLYGGQVAAQALRARLGADGSAR
jgi:acyl-CoA thioesterase